MSNRLNRSATVITFDLLSGIGSAMTSAWMAQNFGQSMPLIGGLLAVGGLH